MGCLFSQPASPEPHSQRQELEDAALAQAIEASLADVDIRVSEEESVREARADLEEQSVREALARSRAEEEREWRTTTLGGLPSRQSPSPSHIEPSAPLWTNSLEASILRHDAKQRVAAEARAQGAAPAEITFSNASVGPASVPPLPNSPASSVTAPVRQEMTPTPFSASLIQGSPGGSRASATESAAPSSNIISGSQNVPALSGNEGDDLSIALALAESRRAYHLACDAASSITVAELLSEVEVAAIQPLAPEAVTLRAAASYDVAELEAAAEASVKTAREEAEAAENARRIETAEDLAGLFFEFNMATEGTPRECFICLQPLGMGVKVLPCCGPVLHSDCLASSFRQSRSCPLCRHSYEIQDGRDLQQQLDRQQRRESLASSRRHRRNDRVALH